MKNIQELPEEKRKMIFWVIMSVIALVILTAWVIFDANPRVQRIINTDLGSEFNLEKTQQMETIDQAVERRKEKIQDSLKEMVAQQTSTPSSTFTNQDELEVIKMLQEMAGVTNTPSTTQNNSTNTTSTSIFK